MFDMYILYTVRLLVVWLRTTTLLIFLCRLYASLVFDHICVTVIVSSTTHANQNCIFFFINRKIPFDHFFALGKVCIDLYIFIVTSCLSSITVLRLRYFLCCIRVIVNDVNGPQ